MAAMRVSDLRVPFLSVVTRHDSRERESAPVQDRRGEEYQGKVRVRFDSIHQSGDPLTVRTNEAYFDDGGKVDQYVHNMEMQLAEQGFLVSPYREVTRWNNGRYA